MKMNKPSQKNDNLQLAAKREADRARLSKENPEPSLGARLGQIGFLGWMIVTPAILAMWLGRKIDHLLDTGILFSAALLMLGVGFGFWFAWRWMHSQ